MNPTSMISLALFRINVQSFIKNGSVSDCTLPDEDGVVRDHCIVITEPVQGTGNSIHGAEFDYRQGFTFLPGLLSNTGMEFNATYAPSDSGKPIWPATRFRSRTIRQVRKPDPMVPE